MELPYFVSVRHRNLIESKKGRIPVDVGMLLGGGGFKVNFHADKDGKSLSFDDDGAYSFIQTKRTGEIIALVNALPDEDEMSISRLLGKIAVEAFARIALDVEGGLDDVTDNPGLDLLRNYVRFGTKVKFWPYTMRPIYPEQHFVSDSPDEKTYEVLHEYQLFQTEPHIWHLCLVLFGIEYCLNMCEPVLDDYQNWLTRNEGRSPLYLS